MDVELIKQKLKDEGFQVIYDWKEKPYTMYPLHQHQDKVCFYVIDGRVKLYFKEGIIEVNAGERVDIPPNTMYTGEVGGSGCYYIVGQMKE